MDDVTILTNNSSPSSKLTAANNVIVNYNLHFTPEEVVKSINDLRVLFNQEYVYDLMYLTLTTNLRMFIAIINALLVKLMRVEDFTYFATSDSFGRNYVLGYEYRSAGFIDLAVKTYCTLYDSYGFDITNLKLSDELRQRIQDHINSKRVLTKRAIKK